MSSWKSQKKKKLHEAEKLIVIQPVKKSPAFYRIQRLIARIRIKENLFTFCRYLIPHISSQGCGTCHNKNLNT
jgi:hypothetical protein